LSQSAKQQLEKDILVALAGDSITTSKLYPVIRDLIRDKPELFKDVLAIRLPKELPSKTYVEIMTSKGRGKSYESKAYI